MRSVDDLIIDVLLVVVVGLGAWYGAHHYGAVRYDAGYAAAIVAGQAQHEHDAKLARQTETDLRAQLAQRDAEAFQKDQDHAASLQAAQRRVLTGTDRLRCPASPVQPAATAGDRPAAAAPAADGQGPDIVPEAAADVLGFAADVAGLVRRYGEVVERYDACRAVNAK